MRGRAARTPTMTKPGAIVVVALLLACPAAIVAVWPRAGFVASAAAVVVLVYLVLRNERRDPR